jgi:hypothetical protein
MSVQRPAVLSAWPMAWCLLVPLVLLSACGGGGSGSPGTPPAAGQPPPVGALSASQPGELMAYVRTKLEARHAERLVTPGLMFVDTITPVGVLLPAVLGTTSAATTSGTERSTSTVQEAGVDEPDFLKTDGSLFMSLVSRPSLQAGQPSARLLLHTRRSDGGVDATGALDLLSDADGAVTPSGFLHAAGAQRVLTLGESRQLFTFDWCPTGMACPTVTALPAPRSLKPAVNLESVDVSRPAAPAVAERVRIDGRLVGARQIGNWLYLVTQHSPQLALEALPATATAAERQALLARLSAADLLPTVRLGTAAPVPLVQDTDCYVQVGNGSLAIDITTITAVDMSVGFSRRTSRCFVGGSEALYVSPRSVYLATTRYPVPVVNSSSARPAQMSTDIHKFALDGQTIAYRGSGEVTGHLGWDALRKSFRLSEHNGDLRVVTFTGQFGWGFGGITDQAATTAPSPATLTVLRERSGGGALQTVSTLPNERRPAAIGKPGEQVYAVRFIGDRGYVVTFRRTDPLYVLDLSNPADPQLRGELVVPGFSEDLYPVGPTNSGLLLGVGRDANAQGVATGLRLALFDVSNPSQPRELSALVFGQMGSQSALDFSRQGINSLTVGNTTRVGLPMLLRDERFLATSRALQRFEVDGTARTLRALPPVAGATAGSEVNFGGDRSVQVGAHGYYLNDGQLRAFVW